jgi:hypothetical protein
MALEETYANLHQTYLATSVSVLKISLKLLSVQWCSSLANATNNRLFNSLNAVGKVF